MYPKVKDKANKMEIPDEKPQQAPAPEMTLEEARAYRASRYKPQPVILTEQEKRNAFRLFWAKSRKKYNNKASKELEQILWVHLKATGNDVPEKFEAGIENFGLKKVS